MPDTQELDHYEQQWHQHWRAGLWQDARELSESAHKQEPESPRGRRAAYHLGKLDVMEGQWDQATERLGRVAQACRKAGHLSAWVEATCELAHAQRGWGLVFSALQSLRDLEKALKGKNNDSGFTELPLPVRAGCLARVELEFAQCVGQLGDSEALRRRLARAEAYADLCEDEELQIWTRVVGSRPLASTGRAHNIEEARHRADSAIRHAKETGDAVLEIRARLHRIQADRRAEVPKGIRHHVEAIQRHKAILDRAPRFREQLLQARVNHRVLRKDPRGALALSLTDDDRADYDGEFPKPGQKLTDPTGSHLWRIQFWRRQIAAAEDLNLRGLAVKLLVRAAKYQAEIEPEKVDNTDFSFATKRWFERSREQLAQQRQLVPTHTQEYRDLEEADQALRRASYPNSDRAVEKQERPTPKAS